jgi:AmiR/NasT family two-component response regulator
MSATNGHSAVVQQACGVLMQREGITSEQALAALHARADALGWELVAVAVEIVHSARKHGGSA